MKYFFHGKLQSFIIPNQRYGNELVPAIDVAIAVVEEVTGKADLYLSRNLELDRLLKIHEMIAPVRDFEVNWVETKTPIMSHYHHITITKSVCMLVCLSLSRSIRSLVWTSIMLLKDRINDALFHKPRHLLSLRL